MEIFEKLQLVFAGEWSVLDDQYRELVADDADEVEDLREYRDNIGIGNLHKYAECLAIQAGRAVVLDLL